MLTKDPASTEYDSGMSNCDAATFLTRPQSLTTGNKMATKGVLLKKMDRQKHVMYMRAFPSVTDPVIPKVFLAMKSTIWDFSTAPITRKSVPMVIIDSLEKPTKQL